MITEPVKISGSNIRMYRCFQKYPKLQVCTLGRTRDEAIKKALQEITRPF